MTAGKWESIDIQAEEGWVKGISPVIISASRATDIPAFYSEWFANRIDKGYVKWVNPFNGRSQFVSFSKTRVIVFWTKDVTPLVPYLGSLDERQLNYYFSFTLNDYEQEGLEPGLRKLEQRIDAFKRLSERLGKDRVIWRFDPLVMTDTTGVDALLDKVYRVGSRIAGYTRKLVISFADISTYRKVQHNLSQGKLNYIEFTVETMNEIAEGLSQINKDWGLEIATCAEGINLSKYGIKKNKCIDDDLLIKLFSEDMELMKFLGHDKSREEYTLIDFLQNNGKISIGNTKTNSAQGTCKLKDKGQREHCGCIVSKDIGRYDTCCNQCIYCYANSSPQKARDNYLKYLESDRCNESII